MSDGPNTDTRWVMNRELLERLVGNDRDFREEVLVSLTELKVSMRTMQDSFSLHVKDDAERFGKVNMSIGETSGKLQYILGGAAAAVFVIGLVAGLLKVLM